ncbi:MAG TPA: hypothetical protein VFR90_17265 [Methylibium sp.]|uniref:hypothetical protein n=1 Tax=Methylibium sp. TaxID=2067992 RepID=UPI002DBBC886|nr:hypothetical protein [Methylibium sp.]HEU4460874.1 hypothetical protein [Methylibium sp.]
MALPHEIDSPLARLIEAHPALFRGRAPRVASFVPAGWYGLVDQLCTSIEHVLGPERLPSFEVEQIKEKFGKLRFYYRIDKAGDLVVDLRAADGMQRLTLPAQPASPERQRLRELVVRAENESAVTCATCGASGALRNLGRWLVVLCEEHRAEEGNKRDGPPR